MPPNAVCTLITMIVLQSLILVRQVYHSYSTAAMGIFCFSVRFLMVLENNEIS